MTSIESVNFTAQGNIITKSNGIHKETRSLLVVHKVTTNILL